MPEPASVLPALIRIVPSAPSSLRHGYFASATLPTPVTPLIGHEDDRAAVCALVCHPDVRLLTVTGPPGIGKTHLALQIAADVSDAFAGAVAFVSLAPIRDPALVLPTIARALGIVARDDQPLLTAIEATLRLCPTLLVLDNFEQVLSAATGIAEILALCPQVTVLVTSRSVLHVRGEHEFAVPPLPLPALTPLPPLNTLTRYASVALFLARAGAVIPGFTLTAANAAAVAAICVRLDGMPLAIELAVARLKLFAPDALLCLLDHRLRWLTSGARDLPKRQQTLRDAIAWSDDLLTPAERRLFYALSVCVGGWTMAEAEALVPNDATLVVTGLAALLDNSLIARDPQPEGGARFGMLETIREYAYARLVECGEREAIGARHAAWVCAFAADAGAHLFGAEQARWLGLCEREIGNVRAALTWMLAHDETEQALQCCVSLRNFWLLHDHLTEGAQWLETILARAAPTTPAPARAAALIAAASLALRQGNYLRAHARYTDALAIGEALHDLAIIAPTMLNLGSIAVILGDLDNGQALFEKSLTLAQAAEQPRTVARVLNQLGELARLRGDDEDAARYYEESLTRWRELGERERIAMILHNLGPVLFRMGNDARAVLLLGESLDISAELHNVHGGAICLTAIAPILITHGHPDRAAQLLGAADALRSSIGVHWEPVDQAEYDRGVACAHDAVGAAAFHMYANRGRELTFVQATTFARESLVAIADPSASPDRTPRDPSALTRRERAVVAQIAQGKSNREIAKALFIAEKTVEMHVSNSLSKLGFRSRAQLAAWIVRRDATVPDTAV